MKNKYYDIEKLLSKCEIKPNTALKEKIMCNAKAVTPAPKSNVNFRTRWISAMAACLIIVSVFFGGMGILNEEYMQIYIDVNPSFAVSLNRFDNVVSIEYLNDDARESLSGINIKGNKPERALEKIMQKLGEHGYMENSEMYIGATCKDQKRAENMRDKLAKKANSVKQNRGYTVSINQGNFEREDREKAKDLNLSPMKYKLISQIIELDNNLSVQSLRDKNMKELRKILQELEGQLDNSGNNKGSKK